MTPEEEVAELRLYKKLCAKRVEQAKRMLAEQTAEYNRVRHMLTNRVKALKKEKAK